MRRLTSRFLLLGVGTLAACASGDTNSDAFGDGDSSGDGDGDGDATGDGDGDGDGDGVGDGDGDGDGVGDGDGDGDGNGDGDGDGDGDGAEECGNGAIEGTEECDTGDLGDETCESQGFGGGGLACNADCTFDTSNCIACGNGVVDDAAEDCDGADLGDNETCADVGLGLDDELLGCNDDCTYDYGECSGCGDGEITPPEDCEPPGEGEDKADLNDMTCEDLGFDGGDLDCTLGCAFETNGCFTCGDAVKNGIEECDAADFGDAQCSDFDSAVGDKFTGGTLSCSDTCSIDIGNCTFCGDSLITGDEVCDLAELDGETCVSLGQGYTDGNLACSDTCDAFDESGCTTCGDALIEGTEQCEGNDFNGETCVSLGYLGGGDLSCVGCVIDTSQCADNYCGDAILNGNEDCDCGNQGVNCSAAQLGNEDCADQGFDGGTLQCNSPNNCTFDTQNCYECGDGNVDPGEECDGANLDGQTCQTIGFPGGGTLSCDASCNFVTNQCIALANPVTYCNYTNVTINDNSNALSSIVVADVATVADVNVYLKGNHTWDSDLDVYVRLNGGTERVMFNDICGAGDNFNVTMDDEGPNGHDCAGVPAIDGTVPPTQALSFFDGQGMNGTWQLRIYDDAFADTGFLDEWCVTITWN